MSPPRPPRDLARRQPEIVVLEEGARIERIFTRKNGPTRFAPIFFDKGDGGRLNDPDGNYGVRYGAAELSGAFAETFLREPGRALLPLDLIESKARATLRATRPLRLIALMGAGLARVGATAEVTHGGLPYRVAQAWSKALWRHPERPDGIAYRARHDDDAVCFALFDNPPVCVEVFRREIDLLNQGWFWKLMEAYAVGIAPE